MGAENRICRSSSTMAKVPIPARNMAELLRDLGLFLRWRVRRATGTKRVLLLPQSLRWDSQLALRFVNLKLSVQLCSMVEDWPLHRIQETVQAQRLETLRSQPTSELGDACVAPGSKEITYGGNF